MNIAILPVVVKGFKKIVAPNTIFDLPLNKKILLFEMKNVHGNSLTKEERFNKYIITFKNTLRVHNGLNCYSISVVEEVI